MRVHLTLTNHKTTLEEQHIKLNSEISEYNEAVKNSDADHCVDELIDVAKCALKLAKNICESQDFDFEKSLHNNHEKNEKRGYHD